MAARSGQPVGVLRRRKRRREQPVAAPDEMYLHLREMALAAVANGLSAPRDHSDASGLVVDVPAQVGFATVVALADNTTSMYTSTGGGTIGAGEHESVAAATQRLLAVVQGHLRMFKDREDTGFPSPGTVRFHVLSPSTGRRADVDEDAFWGREPHPLVPVIAAVQDVVSAIRAAAPN
jgi:hypothetical protein